MRQLVARALLDRRGLHCTRLGARHEGHTNLHGRRRFRQLARPIADDSTRPDDDLELSRVVIPPFHFTRDTITFLDADLGPLAANERLVGTYHTHPDDDIAEGLLSITDLRYMKQGHVDFHGAVGWLAYPTRGLDWVFDIVDPREGARNVFAHDPVRLEIVRRRCEESDFCPLDDLRIAGSPYYLLARTYEERSADAGLRAEPGALPR